MDKNSIKTEHFRENLLALLTETFEGSPPEGSRYLDQGVGVLNTIEKISAADASRSIGGATFVSHLEHARHYLVALVEFIDGRIEKVDWDESWLVKTVDEAEWNLLKENVRRDYQTVIQTFKAIEIWDDDKVADAMSIVVHTAYHLGAMRQIMKSL
ncbi:MAG: hypothetical protein M3525_06980 [Acidobacteriota bacterium]|nr:hypothetical protein [Acidobacteriota bacterium]